MAYIPPHKRHIKGSPPPESLIPCFRKNLNLKKPFGEQQQKRNEKYLGGKHIVYAKNAVSKWFSVGLADDSRFSSLVKLEPVSVDQKTGERPLSLVLVDGHGEGYELLDTPWIFVAANVKQDLLLSFQHMKCQMEEADTAEVKPCLVARFGRVLFYGNSFCQESLKTNPLTETTLREKKKFLYTNITPSYMEYMETRVVLKLGLEYVEDEELYYVMVSDKLRPDTTVACKCKISEDHKNIQLHKIVLNRVRHMVSDVSCLGKNTDLRLMLYTKKIEMAFSDEEINGIKDIIGSAILDSEVQGGLRWPFGEDSSGGRYAVIRIDHTTAKSYRNSSIRLKLRHADRFDFRFSTGEAAREIYLKMPGIISQLLKQTIEEDVVFKMLEDNLKLIWDHCLLDGSSS